MITQKQINKLYNTITNKNILVADDENILGKTKSIIKLLKENIINLGEIEKSENTYDIACNIIQIILILENMYSPDDIVFIYTHIMDGELHIADNNKTYEELKLYK